MHKLLKIMMKTCGCFIDLTVPVSTLLLLFHAEMVQVQVQVWVQVQVQVQVYISKVKSRIRMKFTSHDLMHLLTPLFLVLDPEALCLQR